MNLQGMPRKRRAKRPRRPGLRERLLAPLRGLTALVAGRKPRPSGRRRKSPPSPGALLLPGAGRKRSLQEWKELRRSTATEVKAHLAAEQPVAAIKKLTRALLEDPQHPAYHELLKKAVEQRRQRRLRAGRRDPWAELPRDLREEALQLEAFTAYVDELEQLFDKAGIPPLCAPPPPGRRQTQSAAGAQASTNPPKPKKQAREAVAPPARNTPQPKAKDAGSSSGAARPDL